MSNRYPRFLDVSDRQLQEALSVLSLELVPPVQGMEEVMSNEEITRRIQAMGVFNYLRARLPEILGF